MTELRRTTRWATVFLTLKDPEDRRHAEGDDRSPRLRPARARARGGRDRARAGRAELYEQKGELGLRASTIERVGLGAHLVALERLKRRLAAEGLFSPTRNATAPTAPARGRDPHRSGGRARRPRGDDRARFPATKVVVCETRVQGKGAPAAIVAALGALAAHPEVDVVVLARGGGSFEDLLPFSDETVVRAVAACPVPVVSAVGHEQDTPLCDLAGLSPPPPRKDIPPPVASPPPRVHRASSSSTSCVRPRLPEARLQACLHSPRSNADTPSSERTAQSPRRGASSVAGVTCPA